MPAPALIVAGSAVAAVLALLLAVLGRGPAARRVALVSLWLALATIPVSVVANWASDAGEGESVQSTRLARTIADAKNYGSLCLPCTGIAMLALRRARSLGVRRSGAMLRR